MEIIFVDDYDKLSELACNNVVMTIENNKNALFCLATGDTPTQTYANIHKMHLRHAGMFANIRIIKLDEWCDMPVDEKCTCESYLHKNILAPLSVSDERYFTFSNKLIDSAQECTRINKVLESEGPIDLIILGLGQNGHVGLNEPNTWLKPHAHVVKLSKQTKMHSMLDLCTHKPNYGISLGIADILSAKKILLLVSGSGKQNTVKKLLTGNISTHLPASLLWLHSDVSVIVDSDSMQ